MRGSPRAAFPRRRAGSIRSTGSCPSPCATARASSPTSAARPTRARRRSRRRVEALTGLLLGREFLRGYGERVAALARETGAAIEPIPLPEDPAARLAPSEGARVEIAYFSGDIHPAYSGAFFAAAFGAG